MIGGITMHKKTIVFTLLASMLFMFSSCNSNEDEESFTQDIAYLSNIPCDFVYKDRHYLMLQDIGIKNTVDQEDIGRLLGYIIREDDIDAFTSEYPNVDYVIYNYVYHSQNKNRVPFFMIVGYDDLSFICCDNYIYMDVTDFPQ